MTSRMVELPASSEALTAIRFASGATPMYLPRSGSPRRAVERVAGDDAGDVRAVAEAVARGRGPLGRDRVGDDARVARRVLEVDRVTGDAGVDDGDADPLAGVTATPDLVGVDRLRELGGERPVLDRGAVHARVEREADDLTLGGELGRLLGRQLHGQAVDERHAAGDLAAMGGDERLGLALREAGLELHDGRDLARRGLLGQPSDGGALGCCRAERERCDRGHHRPRRFSSTFSGHLRVRSSKIRFEAGGRAISRPCETSSFASPPHDGYALFQPCWSENRPTPGWG